MIGMINLSNDGPLEFYAAPVAKVEPTAKLQRGGRPTSLDIVEHRPDVSSSSKSSPPQEIMEKIRVSHDLFLRRLNEPSYGYCADGRRCMNGRPVNQSSKIFQTLKPSQLWDELLRRQMVNKVISDLVVSIQDEIDSPVDTVSRVEKTFGWKSLFDRQRTRSESTAERVCDTCTAAIYEELGASVKKERVLADIFSPRDDLIVDALETLNDSESLLNDIVSDLLTPPMSSAMENTKNLFEDS